MLKWLLAFILKDPQNVFKLVEELAVRDWELDLGSP